MITLLILLLHCAYVSAQWYWMTGSDLPGRTITASPYGYSDFKENAIDGNINSRYSSLDGRPEPSPFWSVTFDQYILMRYIIVFLRGPSSGESNYLYSSRMNGVTVKVTDDNADPGGTYEYSVLNDCLDSALEPQCNELPCSFCEANNKNNIYDNGERSRTWGWQGLGNGRVARTITITSPNGVSGEPMSFQELYIWGVVSDFPSPPPPPPPPPLPPPPPPRHTCTRSRRHAHTHTDTQQ